jgi:hypothetical protein
MIGDMRVKYVERRGKSIFLVQRQTVVDSQVSRSIAKQNDLSTKGKRLVEWSNFGLLHLSLFDTSIYLLM